MLEWENLGFFPPEHSKKLLHCRNAKASVSEKPKRRFPGRMTSSFCQKLIQFICHGFGACGQMSERKRDLHTVVFRLTNLAEGEQLDLIHAGITLGDLLQRKHIFAAVVDRGNDDLTNGDGDIFPIQAIEKIQRGLHGTADVFAVLLLVCILDIEKHTVCLLQKRLDRIGQNTSGGIQTGVDPVLVAKREDLSRKIRLQKRFAARKGDAALLTEIFTVAQDLVYDLLGGIFRAFGISPRVGIVTAFATQMTALEKHDEADAGTVNRAEALKRVNSSHLTWIRGRYG